MTDNASSLPSPLSGSEQDETGELRPRFNADGLIAAIAQDADTHEVLMLAWMNEDALRETIKQGRAVYWSRSRQQLWRKGDTSGAHQTLVSIAIDCDQDAVLMKVRQAKGGACHTGRSHCFYREIQPDLSLKSTQARPE